MSQPSLRGRVVLKFPANVVAGPGISIVKEGGTYTFSATGGGGGGGGGIPEAPVDGLQYGRQNAAWTVVTGGGAGTVGNPLLIEKGAQPQIGIIGTVGSLNRWRVNLGDSEVESGTAIGSDFHIESYNNDGSYRNLVMHIDRDTSEVRITSGPAPHHAMLSLNKLLDGQANTFQGLRSGSLRWGMALGDSGMESTPGDNDGSDFRLNRYDDNGTFVDVPLYIERKTGMTVVKGGLVPDKPVLAINKIASGQASSIEGWTNNVRRWGLSLGDVDAEVAPKTGSNLRINRFDHTGTIIDVPLQIKRDTGTTILIGTHPSPPTGPEPTLVLRKTAGGMPASIQGQTGLLPRWDIVLGDSVNESGTATGSDFRVHRYDNSGTILGVAPPLWIRRSDGVTVITASPPDQAPILVINKTSGTSGNQSSSIQGATNLSTRWHMALGDGQAESGAESGSNFRLHRHNNSGTFLDTAMYIQRDNLEFRVFGDCFNPGGGPWFAISDSRIKTVQGDYTVGLTEVLQLRPVKYVYKGNDSPAPGFPSNHKVVAERGQEFVGLVAQEAETVMPEMVSQSTAYIDGVQVTDMRTMDTNALIYALVNAVKELSARVEALEAGP